MFLPVIILAVVINGAKSDKRLVLHSDVETAAAIQVLTARMEAMAGEITHLKSIGMGMGGSVYIRWGRTVCQPNDTELVYKGYAAGNIWSTSGAADFICLTGDPLWDQYAEGAQTKQQLIYGVEYVFGQQFPDGGAKFFGNNLDLHDPPCAVCRSIRPTSVMIPGRNQCYPGWTMEYWGYIVTGDSIDKSASNYVCLDSNAEWQSGDSTHQDGKLMYVVQASCGTIKCPPYLPNRLITCVVCSK